MLFYIFTNTLHIVCPIHDICTFFTFYEFCPVVTNVAVEFCPVADVAVVGSFPLTELDQCWLLTKPVLIHLFGKKGNLL